LEPLNLLLHPQRRVERPLGMILVCNRRAEESENSVPPVDLRYITAIMMDRIHHQLECWIYDRPRLLGVEVPIAPGNIDYFGSPFGKRYAERAPAKLAEAD
jgi:hypothetical protein